MRDLGTHEEPRTNETKEKLGDQLDKAKIGDTVTMGWEDQTLPEIGKTYSRGWDWSRWKVVKIVDRMITFQKVKDGNFHRD